MCPDRSDHPHRAVLPQAEHIAAARAEHPLDLAAVARQPFLRDIGLDGACKAAALHPPRAAAALQDALAQRQRTESPWCRTSVLQ